MEVYQVRVFLEVARHLSFTEAADVLNLTQPAVSAKIKSLESELGTALFYRLGRKNQLTEAGQFLLEEGPKLIQVENQLLQKIEEIKKGKFGHLSIGCTAALSDSWLPKLIFEYRQQYRDIQTQYVVFDAVEYLYRAITDQQVDLGISDIGFADFSEISTTIIDSIAYTLFVSSTHRLATQNWLSLKELIDYPWVILPSGSPSRLMFELRLAELGISLADFSQLEVVDTPSLMRIYMVQGDYLGFASNVEFRSECESGLLVSISLQEFSLPGNVYLLSPKRLSVSLASSRRSRSLNPAQKFIELIHNLRTDAPANYPHSSPARLRSPTFTVRPTNSQHPETLTLSIGVQNCTIPAVIAGLVIQRLGLLEHFLPKDERYSTTQYEIRWCDFPTGSPIVEGLRTGQLDIGVLGDYPLLLSGAQPELASKKTRLVSFVASNPDGSCNAVIVPNRSKLKSIEELRGRVVAVPFSSSAHSMVMRSLKAANLLNDVKIISLEHPNSHQLFEFPAHLADGYAHFAPFHDVACRGGKFRYLVDSDQERLPVFYGVVVGAQLAEKHPDIVIAYLKALAAAQYWYDSTPAALPLVSQWTRVETEIVAQILSSTYQKNQSGRFFSEMVIRPDWVRLHIDQLTQIPGNESLNEIDVNNWIQLEFLHQLNKH